MHTNLDKNMRVCIRLNLEQKQKSELSADGVIILHSHLVCFRNDTNKKKQQLVPPKTINNTCTHAVSNQTHSTAQRAQSTDCHRAQSTAQSTEHCQSTQGFRQQQAFRSNDAAEAEKVKNTGHRS